MKLIFWAIVIWLAWTFYFRPRLDAGQRNSLDRSSRSNPLSSDDDYIDVEYEEVEEDRD